MKNKNKTYKPTVLNLLRQKCVMSPQRRRQRKMLEVKIILIAIILSASAIGGYTQYSVNAMNIDTVTVAKNIKKEIKSLTVNEYVKQEIEKKGLIWKDVSCLLDNENYSRNVYKIYDNPNGAGVDRGLFMISSYWHPEVKDECAFNKECSTRWFIKTVLQDKNYHQWHGYTKNCQ